MFRRKAVHIPIYAVNLIFIETDDLRLLKKEYPGLNYEEDDFYGLTFYPIFKRNFVVVIAINTPREPDPDWLIACISHECNHAAMTILGRAGVSMSMQEQEPLAYLQGYILKEALNFYPLLLKKKKGGTRK